MQALFALARESVSLLTRDASERVSSRVVNGSMRMPLRMNADHHGDAGDEEQRLAVMCMPYSPKRKGRRNRLPNAQPPAKAAPNTSAAIRIAAESTVDTLIQLMRRAARLVGGVEHGAQSIRNTGPDQGRFAAAARQRTTLR